MGLTGVYFREDTKESAPPAYITLDTNVSTAPLRVRTGTRPPSATAWGITDLTIFVSAYHNIVIDVANVTDGFFCAASAHALTPFSDKTALTRRLVADG